MIDIERGDACPGVPPFFFTHFTVESFAESRVLIVLDAQVLDDELDALPVLPYVHLGAVEK